MERFETAKAGKKKDLRSGTWVGCVHGQRSPEVSTKTSAPRTLNLSKSRVHPCLFMFHGIKLYQFYMMFRCAFLTEPIFGEILPVLLQSYVLMIKSQFLMATSRF